MYVYLLHFNSPIAHAQHYVGSTMSLESRLAAHAAGRGSRLTAEFAQLRIPFILGGVWQCTRESSRITERRLKERKNAPFFCRICAGNKARRLSGVERIDEILPPKYNFWWPTKWEEPSSAMIQPMQLSALEELISLQRLWKEEIGHIPTDGLRRHCRRGEIIEARIGSKMVGACVYGIKRDVATIHQMLVADECRGCGFGAAMVRHAWRAARINGAVTMKAKVRHDLPSNDFWRACGFTVSKVVKHKTSKKTANIWVYK